MNLNIEDMESYELAQAISLATGDSITVVVKEALRERFYRLEQRKRASVEELLELAGRVAAYRGGTHTDHADLLYDEQGLPR